MENVSYAPLLSPKMVQVKLEATQVSVPVMLPSSLFLLATLASALILTLISIQRLICALVAQKLQMEQELQTLLKKPVLVKTPLLGLQIQTVVFAYLNR